MTNSTKRKSLVKAGTFFLSEMMIRYSYKGGDFMEKKNTDREHLTRLEKLKEQSPQGQKELLEKGEITRLQYEVNRRININIPKDK